MSGPQEAWRGQLTADERDILEHLDATIHTEAKHVKAMRRERRLLMWRGMSRLRYAKTP